MLKLLAVLPTLVNSFNPGIEKKKRRRHLEVEGLHDALHSGVVKGLCFVCMSLKC